MDKLSLFSVTFCGVGLNVDNHVSEESLGEFPLGFELPKVSDSCAPWFGGIAVRPIPFIPETFARIRSLDT